MSPRSAKADPGAAAPGPQEAAIAHVAKYLVVLSASLFAVGVVWRLLSLATENRGARVSIADAQAVARADGRRAPSFTMPALDGGGDISLSDYRGEIVVLNFWASWCGPCRKEARGLQADWQRFGDRGVQFLGANYRDDPAAARAFDDEFGVMYPSVQDPAGELAFRYDLLAVPTTYLIGADRRIAYRFVGYVDEGVLRATLSKMLRE